eukprot:4193670-Amphidinium_carterae.1
MFALWYWSTPMAVPSVLSCQLQRRAVRGESLKEVHRPRMQRMCSARCHSRSLFIGIRQLLAWSDEIHSSILHAQAQLDADSTEKLSRSRQSQRFIACELCGLCSRTKKRTKLKLFQSSSRVQMWACARGQNLAPPPDLEDPAT